MKIDKNLMRRVIFLTLLVSTFNPDQPVIGQTKKAQNSSFRIEKNRKAIRVIDEYIKTIYKRFRKGLRRDPQFMLRLSEQHYEKAKLLQQIENEIYLGLSPSERNKKKKKDFFKKSYLSYQEAQNKGLKGIQLTREQKLKADIYLILGSNAKEFNQDEEAKSLLKKSINLASEKSQTRRHAQLSLAEIYFNQAEFKSAQLLYEDALQFTKYRWWVKDAFNLAYCYFKQKDYATGIGLMEDVYFKSKQKQYINISEKVLKHITLFFATSKQIEKGIDFFKRAKIDISHQLIELTKILMQKAYFSTAEKTLARALDFSQNRQKTVTIRLKRMEVYEQFGKEEKLLKEAQIIFAESQKIKINPKTYKEYTQQVLKVSAKLQKDVVGKLYIGVPETRKKKALKASTYFRMLVDLEPAKAAEYKFYEGETLFVVGEFDNSLEVYFSSLKLCKKTKCKKELQGKIVSSLLATLGHEELSRKRYKKFLIPIYENVLSVEPKSKRAQKIYVKLFNAYIEKNNVKKGEGVLVSYKKFYAKDAATQEGMIARIMDVHRQKENLDELFKWAERLSKKEFIVSSKYLIGLHKSLATMQFKRIQTYVKKGEKKKALAGYKKIYRYKYSPKEAKVKSAYNVALLFLELGWMNNMTKWMSLSLSLMDKKEVLSFSSTYLTMVRELFLKRKILTSAKMGEKLFQKLCSLKFQEKDTLFKSTYALYLNRDYSSKAKSLRFGQAEKCQVSPAVLAKLDWEDLQRFEQARDYSKLEKKVNELGKDKQNYGRLLSYLGPLYHHYQGRSSKKAEFFKAKIVEYYDYLYKNRPKSLSSDAIDLRVSFMFGKMNKLIKTFNQIKLEFPEDKFNQVLKLKLDQLSKITDAGVYLLKQGSGKASMQAYKNLVEVYAGFAKEIDEFTPPNKPKEYLGPFRSSMASLSQPLSAKAADFLRSGRRLIQKKNIFSEDSFWFHSYGKFPISVEFRNTEKRVLMDRWGES